LPRGLEGAVTGLLVLSATAIAVSFVHSTYSVNGERPRVGDHAWDFVDGWEEGLSIGYPVEGSDTARVKIIILADLECPVCKEFHVVAKSLVAEYPNKLQLVYVLHPLSYHQYAWPAARIGICASEVGAFSEWIDAVFAKQDSMGVRSWGAYALDAGVSDTSRITDCAFMQEQYCPVKLTERAHKSLL
jgi:peroxiredoxin